MKALRVATGTSISPFGGHVGSVAVGWGTLQDAQDRALAEAGLERVEEPPANEPYVIFEDHTWFTAGLLRILMKGRPGRVHVEDEGFWTTTGPLQQTPEPGLYALGLHPGGQAPIESLPARTIELSLKDFQSPQMHPQMAHAMRPLRVGSALVHQVNHWTHILRINQLMLAAEAEAAWERWESANIFQRTWTLSSLLWRAKGWRTDRILRSLSEIHSTAEIHPSAVIEASRIGPGAKVGPMSVVRNSLLGEGSRVEAHATVAMSCLGTGSHVGRYALVNLSTAWPGARISSGGGYQCCLFGRDCFVAWGATVLDLSFGREVKVLKDGQRVGSGHHFIGAAIGHEACLGNGVRVNHGMEIPNGSVLVAGADALLRQWPDSTPKSAIYTVAGGRPVPLNREE